MTKTRLGAAVWLACIAQFMLPIDDTITNVALPTISHQLHFSESSLSWVVNAYLLTFGGLLLVGGRLADRFGPRRMFAVGLIGFGVTSMLSGLAPSAGVLVAARAGQGIFGAILSPAALSIVLSATPDGGMRRRALAIWAALLGLGATTGLIAGGAIVQLISWRWIFFINAPVVIVALALMPRLLPADTDRERRALPNVAGAALATLSLLVLVYSVVQTDHHAWTSATTLVGLGIAVALAVAFAISERRSSSPLLPPELLARTRAMRADLIVFLGAAGLLAMFLFQTLYLQRVLGFGPLRTGLSFLPFSLSMGVSSGLMGRLPQRVDIRIPLSLGFGLAAVGLWLMSRLTPASDYYGAVLPALAVTGIGLGLAFVPVVGIATDDAEERDGGLASGLMTTAQQIGGALGIAVLITVATGHTNHLVAHGTRVATAVSRGFSVAFSVEAGIFVAAGLLTAMLLAPRSGPATQGQEMGSSSSPRAFVNSRFAE